MANSANRITRDAELQGPKNWLAQAGKLYELSSRAGPKLGDRERGL